MADLDDILPKDDISGAPDPADLLSDPESRPDRVVARLKEAVRRAGGSGAVAIKSGVNPRTLSRILAGKPARQDKLKALADACGVYVEWLLTGQGPQLRQSGMHEPARLAIFQPNAIEPPALAPDSQKSLFATLDMDRMAAALEAADSLFRARGFVPDARRRAQILAILYDATADAVGAFDAEAAAKAVERSK